MDKDKYIIYLENNLRQAISNFRWVIENIKWIEKSLIVDPPENREKCIKDHIKNNNSPIESMDNIEKDFLNAKFIKSFF